MKEITDSLSRMEVMPIAKTEQRLYVRLARRTERPFSHLMGGGWSLGVTVDSLRWGRLEIGLLSSNLIQGPSLEASDRGEGIISLPGAEASVQF